MKLAALAVLVLLTSGCAVIDFLDGKHLQDRQEYPSSSYGGGYGGTGGYSGGGGGRGGHSH